MRPSEVSDGPTLEWKNAAIFKGQSADYGPKSMGRFQGESIESGQLEVRSY
jgi:hypothetical protein